MYDRAGFTVPEGVNALCNQVSLAAQLPHAVGLAWGRALKKRPGVVVAFVGDGGSSEGDFFEACNLAGVVKAPVIFIVQNNGWAMSTPFSRQTAAASIADRGPGFGIASQSVDGNDFQAVFAAISDAVTAARAGDGPALIERRCYRMGAHNTNDDPTRYRDAGAHAEREVDDPLDRLEYVMRTEGIWTDKLHAQHTGEVIAQLASALEWAKAQPESGLDGFFDHVYAEPPRRLERQRGQFRSEGTG
jgi:pyruvate dehydrogenase E1 component alpha subunit